MEVRLQKADCTGDDRGVATKQQTPECRGQTHQRYISRIPASYATTLDLKLANDTRRRILLPGRQGCKNYLVHGRNEP